MNKLISINTGPRLSGVTCSPLNSISEDDVYKEDDIDINFDDVDMNAYFKALPYDVVYDELQWRNYT